MIRQTLIKELAEKKNLQVLIDKTSEMFRPQEWKKHMDWKYTLELNWNSYEGAVRNAAAATVTSFDSSAPLRTRKTIKKATGEIPTIQEKFQMDKKDLRLYLELSEKADTPADTLLDLVFNDVQEVAEAPGRRLDMMFLEALSTGKITLDTTNNPDGIVEEEAIDIGVPDANKYGTDGAIWSNATDSTPITDIESIVADALADGKVLTKMYMRRSTFNNFKKSAEVKEHMSSWIVGNKNSNLIVTLDSANEFLLANGLPTIELKDQSIAIEDDGELTYVNPFDEYNVTFVTGPNLGDMLYSFTVEEKAPQENITYAKADNVLIKRWGQVEPLKEFTSCEIPAFPAFKNVGSMYILNTNNTSTYA